jgi:hypothetical protein
MLGEVRPEHVQKLVVPAVPDKPPPSVNDNMRRRVWNTDKQIGLVAHTIIQMDISPLRLDAWSTKAKHDSSYCHRPFSCMSHQALECADSPL